MSKYKIVKHGNMYFDKYKPRFCPECASEIIKSNRKSEIDYVFFQLIKRTRTYSCLKCHECGCEMQKLKKMQVKPCKLFWKILLSILFISITIFTCWFTIYSIKHDHNCETRVGYFGTITYYITAFMIVFDIYYIADMVRHTSVYREY